ncbi:hypothetical protein [Nostoc sp.]|uniref:hypothetical protein n=1 Tax=Nostoc sp. TaxID=1180 RepID=UPI0035931BFB
MSETSAVQRPMLKYAYQIGWEYLTAKEALQRREGKGEEKLKERYFGDVLRSQLIKLNPGVVTSNNIDEILRRLRNIDNTIEGNREALNWLQGKQSIVKFLNLSKALFRDVHEQSQRSPFLISIGERAEIIRASFENRQIEARVALARLDEIANECVEAESERQRLKVDENTFAIYTVIKQAVHRLDINQAEGNILLN